VVDRPQWWSITGTSAGGDETFRRLVLWAVPTAIGIAIAAAAFLIWPNPSREEDPQGPRLAPPQATAR
jgi:hypothetical protein